MRGLLTVAKFSFAELAKSKVFKTVLVIAVLVNFVVCFMGYWTVSRSQWSSDIIDSHKQEMEWSGKHPGVNEPRSQDPDEGFVWGNQQTQEITDQVALANMATFLKWFAYAIYIFFGNILVIFIAIGLMAPELERRSIYTLISKPLSRTGILFGKILGVYMTQIVYALIMLLTAQIFFLSSGAGFQKTIFIPFAVGFIDFMIFGALATFFSIHFRQIQAAVLTIMVLWVSTYSGMFFIKTIGHELFKFGEWLDYLILLFPQQKDIGFYALSFIFDKYQQSLLSDLPIESIKLVSKDPMVLLQPVIWLASILVMSFLAFYKKEFD
jgi:ABC-type transport system involved in multi-copper enzyme maturation permease subunit